MELEHLNNLELAALDKETPRPASRTSPRERAPLQPLSQLQHGLGNRALGQLLQARYADDHKAHADDHKAHADDHKPHADERERRADNASAPKSSGNEGRPLNAGERDYFEPRFGQDFSGVRLHTGAEAAESARTIGARAYAMGQDIVFAHGQYAPHTESGLRLMAHELAHVVQQRRPGGSGASPESGAHEAAERVASGHTVSAPSVGSAAPGLYADNGFSLSPGLADSPSSFGLFKVPPQKVSRTLLLYLINNGLMTAEMRRMLLRGEIVIEDAEPKPTNRAGGTDEGGQGLFDPRSDFDELLRRVTQKRNAEEEAAARAAPSQGPSPYATPKPLTGPLRTPGDEKKKLFEFKGLVEGIDFNLPLSPNLSMKGLTLDVFKKGRFDAKLVAGLDQSIEVQLTYRDWHLMANIDTDGKWEMKLSYPNDSPAPGSASLEAIFSQGERALREAVGIVKVGPGLDKFDALKEKVKTLATPLKNAADAGEGISKIQRGVNVSVVIGAGPAPGNLPQSALEGRPQPSKPSGAYAGLRLTFYF